MNVGDLVSLKEELVKDNPWNSGMGLILAIEKHFGWKDAQAFVYWPNENKVWTFSVRHLEVISESR